jgi:hypothetical protein
VFDTLLDPGGTASIPHSLAEEPLLSLDALADAADRMPGSTVVQRSGDQPVVGAREPMAPAERPGDVTRGVLSSGRWVRLTSLTMLPEYAELLPRAAGQFELMLRARGERILAHDLLAFVAGPGTTVPAHVDCDHQMLMQIRGSKTVRIGTYTDPTVAQLQTERAFAPTPLPPSVHPDRCESRTLLPGDGLVIAASTFHWIENGNDDVSIALTCVARTERNTRDAAAHRFNRRVRTLGLHPTPPGRNVALDRAKQRVARATVRRRRGG